MKRNYAASIGEPPSIRKQSAMFDQETHPSMTSERFAVIVLNYFSADDTRRCLDSVARYLHAACFVVDNSANIDERAALEQALAGRPEICLLYPAENLGFAAGVNWALKTAISEGFGRFLLLNSDAELIARSDMLLSRALTEHPGSLIAPVIRWGEGICRNNFYHPYLGLLYRHRPRNPNGWIRYLTGCALVFDRHLLETAGWLDETFFFYGEDIFFCHQIQNQGGHVVLLENKLVRHDGSRSARLASFFYEYHIARMHWLLTFKLLDNRLCQMAALTCKMATLFCRAVIRCFRYRTLAPMLALVTAPLPIRVRPRQEGRCR